MNSFGQNLLSSNAGCNLKVACILTKKCEYWILRTLYVEWKSILPFFNEEFLKFFHRKNEEVELTWIWRLMKWFSKSHLVSDRNIVPEKQKFPSERKKCITHFWRSNFKTPLKNVPGHISITYFLKIVSYKKKTSDEKLWVKYLASEFQRRRA